MGTVKRKQVLIIYDPSKYNDNMILDDLRDEGFPYYFKLFTDVDWVIHDSSYIREADEVWCFGDVSTMQVYKECVKLGADIWDMTGD